MESMDDNLDFVQDGADAFSSPHLPSCAAAIVSIRRCLHHEADLRRGDHHHVVKPHDVVVGRYTVHGLDLVLD